MKRMLMPMALAAATLAVIAGAAPESAPRRQIKFVAPKTVIYHEKKLVVATGGVELTSTEGMLWADKMEGTYADTAQGSEWRSFQATGNVRVDLDWVGSDKKKRRIKAKADRGTYTVADRTIILAGHVTGNAVEVEGQTTIDLKGDKVTLYLSESRYEVEGAPTEIIFTEPEPATEAAPTKK